MLQGWRQQLHQSVCTALVFVPWAVIATNPRNSLPLDGSLLLGYRRPVSDKPGLWTGGSAAKSKMQVLLLAYLEQKLRCVPGSASHPSASKRPDVSPPQPEWQQVLSLAVAMGVDARVPAKPLKIQTGHKET